MSADTLEKINDIKAIDAYLEDQEQRYTDIVDGTQKQVHWADQVGQKTEYSIIYMHGFSASRGEVAPLSEIIAKHLKANVFYTRLSGHGRSVEAMGEPDVDDWLEDSKEAYKIGSMIGDKVIAIGTSTGGTLIAWLAHQDFADSLHSAVMISSNFGVRDKKAYLLPYRLGMKIAKWINGPYWRFEVQNELHAKYWTEKYPLDAVVPMIELVKMVNKLDRSEISIPHLNIYSRSDEVINPSQIERYHQELGGQQNQLVEVKSESNCGNHVLAGDACSPTTTDDMAQIIKEFLAKLSD